ncbi:hypothetical protein [Streptomyces sp. NPDC054863]
MAPISSSGVLAAVNRHFADPRITDDIQLTISLERGTVSLSPAEARHALYGPEKNPVTCAAIWTAAIRSAQADTGPQGTWQLLLLWLAWPRLNKTAYKISTGLQNSLPDIESELVLGLLEALPAADPESHCAMDDLLRTARRGAGRLSRDIRSLRPVGYIESLARDNNHPGADAREEARASGTPDWELEIAPPNGPGGLRAPLRLVGSAAQREGEVLGELAGRLHLHHVTRQVRRAGRREHIGTLSLRPSRRRR